MIRIDLRPEVEARLTEQAQARGVEVSAYVESLLEAAVAARSVSVRRQPTREEMRAFFEAMAASSEKLPQLPDEAFERKSFHQGHD
jgi:post-segregation antitoxin (ccd killing protein)